ncbi:MAG: hypothetical protein KDE33_14695 [Bacteroidetes bacterium]|nr:hypothetical protein [Bacteroidota bacterium]MCB9225558.1 hypothetical protein [Chitinophagales bacterium]
MILIVHIYLVLADVKVYPSIIFPHFHNKGFNKEITYINTSFKLENEEIDILPFFKPHDKRFYLFYLRRVVNSKDVNKDLQLLNQLTKSDQLYTVQMDTLVYDMDY